MSPHSTRRAPMIALAASLLALASPALADQFTRHERAPRSLEEVQRVWPSAAAIEAAKALKAQAEAKALPKKEPK